MTLSEDIHALQAQVADLDERLAAVEKGQVLQQELIAGERGLAKEVQGLRKGAYWLAGVIITSSIGLTFAVVAGAFG